VKWLTRGGFRKGTHIYRTSWYSGQLQAVISISVIHNLNSLDDKLKYFHNCLHQSSGNGFQRRTFHFLWVSELSQCLNCIYSLLTLSLKLCYDRCSVGQSILVSDPHFWPSSKFLLMFDICSFLVVGRPPWWEEKPVICLYNCHWASSAMSLSGPSPAQIVP
jgi:hypothetical protein